MSLEISKTVQELAAEFPGGKFSKADGHPAYVVTVGDITATLNFSKANGRWAHWGRISWITFQNEHLTKRDGRKIRSLPDLRRVLTEAASK